MFAGADREAWRASGLCLSVASLCEAALRDELAEVRKELDEARKELDHNRTLARERAALRQQTEDPSRPPVVGTPILPPVGIPIESRAASSSIEPPVNEPLAASQAPVSRPLAASDTPVGDLGSWDLT